MIAGEHGCRASVLRSEETPGHLLVPPITRTPAAASARQLLLVLVLTGSACAGDGGEEVPAEAADEEIPEDVLESYLAANRAAYLSFVDGLDEAEHELVDHVVRDSAAWRLYGTATLDGSARDISWLDGGIFDAPPMRVRGVLIQEDLHPGVANARASCLPDGQPIIYYNQSYLRSLSPWSFPFLREHERAHYELGHVRCHEATDDERYPEPRSGEEKLADCSALGGLDGYEISREQLIGGAAQRLYAMGPSRDSLHDDGPIRAAYVSNGCSD